MKLLSILVASMLLYILSLLGYRVWKKGLQSLERVDDKVWMTCVELKSATKWITKYGRGFKPPQSWLEPVMERGSCFS